MPIGIGFEPTIGSDSRRASPLSRRTRPTDVPAQATATTTSSPGWSRTMSASKRLSSVPMAPSQAARSPSAGALIAAMSYVGIVLVVGAIVEVGVASSDSPPVHAEMISAAARRTPADRRGRCSAIAPDCTGDRVRGEITPGAVGHQPSLPVTRRETALYRRPSRGGCSAAGCCLPCRSAVADDHGLGGGGGCGACGACGAGGIAGLGPSGCAF